MVTRKDTCGMLRGNALLFGVGFAVMATAHPLDKNDEETAACALRPENVPLSRLPRFRRKVSRQ